MKKDVYIAVVSVILFTIINLIGGLVNDAMNYSFGSKNVISAIPFHLIFAALFWLTCLPKVKIRKSFRLPLIRTIFWSIIAFNYYASDGYNQLITGDFIDAAVPPFCFFINTIGIGLNQLNWVTTSHFNLIGITIIGVSLYQITILEISTLIINIFDKHYQRII